MIIYNSVLLVVCLFIFPLNMQKTRKIRSVICNWPYLYDIGNTFCWFAFLWFNTILLFFRHSQLSCLLNWKKMQKEVLMKKVQSSGLFMHRGTRLVHPSSFLFLRWWKTKMSIQKCWFFYLIINFTGNRRSVWTLSPTQQGFGARGHTRRSCLACKPPCWIYILACTWCYNFQERQEQNALSFSLSLLLIYLFLFLRFCMKNQFWNE